MRRADVVPFVAMLMITCLDTVVLNLSKAAMNDGMGGIVYVIYHNALGTLILLPFFIFHIARNVDRPPLTFRILFRFFILGLFGICLFQVLVYMGIGFSSPTMATAIWNLGPGITFLIAVIFRMEKLDIRSSSSVAKLFGTMIEILGAMVFIFYQGPYIFHGIHSSHSPTLLLSSQPSTWVLGGLIITAGGLFGCIWTVLQAATIREYPDQQAVVFFFSLFGTLQCVALSPLLEPNQSAWVVQSRNGVTAVIMGAVCSTVVHNNVVTWCLRKKGPVFVVMFAPLSIVISVIMGVTFLGDSLHLGSVIGATIIAGGFYMVIWGLTKEKKKILVVMGDDLDVLDEHGSSDPLLSIRNEEEC